MVFSQGLAFQMECFSGVMGVDKKREMSEELTLILKYMERQARALEENRDALLLLDRRMESLGSDLKGVAESVQTIARRQTDLEFGSERRRENCIEIMKALAERLSAIEKEKTPTLKAFTAEEMNNLYITNGSLFSDGDNGAGDNRLSLAAAEADETEDEEEYEEEEE